MSFVDPAIKTDSDIWKVAFSPMVDFVKGLYDAIDQPKNEDTAALTITARPS